MKEQYMDFENTQFIIFDYDGMFEEASDLLNVTWENSGFVLVPVGKLDIVKIDFFKEHLLQHTFELEQDSMLPDTEGWTKLSEPSKTIAIFCERVKRLARSNRVKNLRVILTDYASVDKTQSIRKVHAPPYTLLNALALMAFPICSVGALDYENELDVLPDNLVIEIADKSSLLISNLRTE